MRFTFLGTGTSCGVPTLGCTCKVCQSSDPHDTRLRTAGLLETESTRILLDCGPDIRQQMLHQSFRKIDAVLLTHIHYDHVAGIDDLKPFCHFGDLEIYANASTVRGLHQTMPYCFAEHLYPGVPRLNLHVVSPHQPLRIGDIDVMPIEVMHDQLPILGYRFGRFAYITDMKSIDSSEVERLRGVDTLVVNALRWECPHHSHMLVDDAIAFSRNVGARITYFIHMNHEIGLHAEASTRLPAGFHLAFDGEVIEV